MHMRRRIRSPPAQHPQGRQPIHLPSQRLLYPRIARDQRHRRFGRPITSAGYRVRQGQRRCQSFRRRDPESRDQRSQSRHQRRHLDFRLVFGQLVLVRGFKVTLLLSRHRTSASDISNMQQGRCTVGSGSIQRRPGMSCVSQCICRVGSSVHLVPESDHHQRLHRLDRHNDDLLSQSLVSLVSLVPLHPFHARSSTTF